MIGRLALAALVAAGVASTGSATAADPVLVSVRVEGKTTTLFGATEPHALAATPLAALDAASRAGELYYHVTSTSFGDYVDQIGRYGGSGSTGWVFKVNDASPPVGAAALDLKRGDRVLWYYADFSGRSGPKTLRLSRVPKASCYRAVAFDDAGNASFPRGAVLHVDGRKLETQGATGVAMACVGVHRGLVRATAPGMVRSNALR
ncbi:MAG TPA: DUF4430 domain-containing protein [Gaiellaceae bacterium]|nr:DUF4430 domain-containing protein [Gaiellaceae bacterium]